MKKEIFNKIFTQAQNQGFSDQEIYYTTATSFEAQILKAQVHEYKNTTHQGISFRGTYNGKMGYAYTEKIEPDIVPTLVNMAKENAQIIESDVEEELFAGSPSYPTVEGLRHTLGQVSATEKIAMAKEMEKIAFALDKRIVAVDYCAIAAGESKVVISNSKGLDLEHINGNGASVISVRAVDGDSTKIGTKLWGGKDFLSFNAEDIAKEAVDLAIKKLGATSIRSGDYPIIIENKIFASLLSIFVSNFFAETVQKGFSLLQGKIGEQIGAPILTIKDNIAHPLSLQANSFDSEGVAFYDKVVIENGILQTYLYNLKAAKKDGVSSTGNGFKASFKTSVATDTGNFFVEPGTIPFSEMIHGFSGVFITGLQGLHAGANPISGDFSLQAEGFLVEKGEVVKPIEQITVAGNFYTLLKNIEKIASDLYFSPFGQIGSPSVLVNGLTVAGE